MKIERITGREDIWVYSEHLQKLVMGRVYRFFYRHTPFSSANVGKIPGDDCPGALIANWLEKGVLVVKFEENEDLIHLDIKDPGLLVYHYPERGG